MTNQQILKKISKISAALLIAAIMFSMLLALAACSSNTAGSSDSGKNDNSPGAGANGDGNEADGDQQQSETAQENQKILSDAPVKDFENYEYRILSRGESYTLWEGTDAAADEENGDLINDAVYKRNRTIEGRYNIQIVNIPSSDILASAKKAISSGSDEYDIMMGALSGFADTLSMGGMLADMKKIPYLDLARPWYDQKANSDLTIANKLYVTISNIGKVDKDATWSYLFNKKLISDFSLENPYQLVREGKWTIDKMLELCKGISRDLNGDGKMDDLDMYGYAGETYNLYLAILSAGSSISKKDANDLPVYTGLDDAGISAFQKLLSMFGDKALCLRADDYYGSGKEVWGGSGVMDTAFKENRILFFDTSMARVIFYRNMDSDFGIVPPPKRDEAQKEYISSVSVRSTNSLCLPITISDFERTGILTDALAAESHYTLIPAYYDLQLKTKFARDDESSEMLDIIFAGRKFDLALLYDWAGVTSTFSNAMQKNSPDIVSALEKIEAKVVAAIEKTIGAYQSFEN